jgi:hypothetical protein
MQLVPIIPQPKTGVEASLEVTGVAAMKPAKPVQERTLPPLLSYAKERPVQIANEIKQHKTREVARQTERRIVCRRLHHQPILEELRCAIDRRRHQQRRTDLRLHIDEEV